MKPESLLCPGSENKCQKRENAYSECDQDDKVSVFNSIIKIFDETIPVRTVRAHCTDKPWMTTNIKALIKERQKACCES